MEKTNYFKEILDFCKKYKGIRNLVNYKTDKEKKNTEEVNVGNIEEYVEYRLNETRDDFLSNLKIFEIEIPLEIKTEEIKTYLINKKRTDLVNKLEQFKKNLENLRSNKKKIMQRIEKETSFRSKDSFWNQNQRIEGWLQFKSDMSNVCSISLKINSYNNFYYSTEDGIFLMIEISGTEGVEKFNDVICSTSLPHDCYYIVHYINEKNTKKPVKKAEICQDRDSLEKLLSKDKEIINKVKIKSKIAHLNKSDEEIFKEILEKFKLLKPIYEEVRSVVNTEKYIKLLDTEKNIILRGAPGTGKTYLARSIAESLTGDGNRTGFVQFHPSYDYTDFVEGLRPINKDENIGFEYKPGIFRKFVADAIKDKDNKYVFIIDEINRGEISKILGELFYSIDPGYRGKSGKVLTQYSNMIEDKHNVEKEFYIPENVYIIGTMNDIDRSVDTFDFAMRRRFAFKEVTAEDSAKNMGVDQTKVYESMKALNDKIISAEVGLTKDYQIGASYFKSISDKKLSDKKLEDELKKLWNNKLEPLFRDYLRGEFDIDGKVQELEKALFSPIKKKNDNKPTDNNEENTGAE